jgi:hypothetical protein
MKKSLLLVIVLLTFSFANAQTIYRYFQAKGVIFLAKYAHPKNSYKSGYLDGNKDPRYIEVYISYQNGKDLMLRVYYPDPYFSKIEVIQDTNADEAFSDMQSIMVLGIREVEEHKKEEIEKIQTYIKTTYNTDPEKWTGKMWMLFALNLNYFSS